VTLAGLAFSPDGSLFELVRFRAENLYPGRKLASTIAASRLGASGTCHLSWSVVRHSCSTEALLGRVRGSSLADLADDDRRQAR
jgi:hypothetical protein